MLLLGKLPSYDTRVIKAKTIRNFFFQIRILWVFCFSSILGTPLAATVQINYCRPTV
jgi:hypothetical protein